MKPFLNRTGSLSVNAVTSIMKINSITRLSLIAVFCGFLFSCNEKEEFTTAALTDFVPLVVGKSITYRLDSMVFTSFGRNTEIHKYQVKHIVDAKITDNEGRPSYRVFTFIRDSVNTSSWTAAQPWVSSNTYYITPLATQLELVENNLRFIKLHLPIRDGYKWKGNKYLPKDAYGPAGYSFSNDDNIEDWDFVYDNFSPLLNYKGFSYTDVYTVEQIDEAFNVPIVTPTAYAAKSRSVEKYSKNIGLVYREYELWEYQPNTGGSGGPYKNGFGITIWMIDHN